MKTEIIEKAENLFFGNGYKATSLQEISDALNIKAASLYYHFPGGKEEIYLEVLAVRLKKYQEHLETLTGESSDIELYLKNFAKWFIEQPPMNMQLIAQMDMPHLSERGKMQAAKLVSESIFAPLRSKIENSRHMLKDFDSIRLVGIYIALLNGMSFAVKQGYTNSDIIVNDFIEMMMRGILQRDSK